MRDKIQYAEDAGRSVRNILRPFHYVDVSVVVEMNDYSLLFKLIYGLKVSTK